MVKKNKIVSFAKIWEPPRRQKFWQSTKNWQVFETGGRTYFALLIDRSVTYPIQIGSSALGPMTPLG